MNSFYKLIANILKEADEAFSGHTSFKIVDPTAVGENPIREISLDAVPLDNNDSILTLAWSGSSEKVLEKKGSSDEINHNFQLISTDLSQIVSLTNEEKYDEAKNAMKEVMKTYASDTSAPVATNMPKLNTTQASDEFTGLWKQAKVSLRNIFPSGTVQQFDFDTTEELKEYQGTSQDNIPLWDSQKSQEKPKDSLAPASLSYEDVEKEKEKEHENMEKHIDETIKTELESALQEKAASVFGPADVALVQTLRAPGIGRNWDEIKKIFIKDLNRDKDSTTIFLDEQRKLSGDEGVEIKVEEEKPEGLRPPKELVTDETHEKLLKDIEEKKSKPPIEEVKEKEIEKVEPPIKEESAQKEYKPSCWKCKKPSTHSRQYGDNDPRTGHWCEECAQAMDKEHEVTFTPQDIMAISELDEIARADNDDIRKVASLECRCGHDKNVHGMGRSHKCTKCDCKSFSMKPTQASLKVKADDLNPLQEPIKEDVTMETPKQDVVPMGKDDHQKPSAGDWVMVKSDLKDELPAFKAKFVSEYMSNDGTEYATVETPDQDLLEVEMYRVTKITDSKPAAQEADPLATPEIEIPQEAPVPVTPKLSDLSSSQDDLSSIKAEAEQLLKDVQSMGKISFKFIKKGLEKHADDSAFEGNGWCRVWIQEDEIASDSRYPEILKLPDENAKIAALKDLALELAHEALRLADSSASKVGVQAWFESLSPSDHDRIDWVALANPKSSEDEDLEFEREQLRKYGPDAVSPDFKDQIVPKSSLESKVEKKASDFEKGISQNKTADPTPLDAPQKTQLRDVKITPDYVEKEKAIPANQEQSQVISRLEAIKTNLDTLDRTKEEVKAKLTAELKKIDDAGERASLESEYQQQIEKLSILIEAVDSKLIKYGNMFYNFSNQETKYVPEITKKEWLEKFKKRFAEAEKFINDVKNGMLALAKSVSTRTLTRWPEKRSELSKQASISDELAQMNAEMLEALKLLSIEL